MDLLNLAKDLLSNVESYVNRSILTNSERFELREQIRADAKRIAYSIDGPEQALKSITRGVRIIIIPTA